MASEAARRGPGAEGDADDSAAQPGGTRSVADSRPAAAAEAAGPPDGVTPPDAPTAPSPAPAASPPAPGAADMGRRTGRGGIAVSAAKLYFILTGLVQQVALKAVLGLEGYGALSSALAAASIAYNPVVGASIQGVSHAVATASEAERPAALRKVLSLHAGIGVVLGGSFFLLAPLLGTWTGALHIVPSLRILSTVLFFYGLYAPLVGALNGRTHFGTQAALDALAATLRSVGLVGGAAWLMQRGSDGTSGVEGATLGFTVSSLLVLLVALSRVGIGRAGTSSSSARTYLRFIGPILLGQVLLNLLFQADQLLLRRFSADAALAAGLDGAAADRLVGAYRAIQLFCFLPYQLVLSVSIVMFPLVARAHRERDRARVASYVRQGMRIALVVTGLIVSVTSGLPGPLLTLVFGADTAALGTGAMRLLALGLGNLALFGVLTAILNSIEQQRIGLIVTALAFVFVVVACLLRVRGLAFGPELLMQTAGATSLALLLATGIAMFIVSKAAGGVLAPACALRVGLALMGALAVAWLLPAARGLGTLLASLGVGTSYVVLLIVSGELGKADWGQLRRIAGKAS